LNVLHFYRTYLPESHGGVEEAIRQMCLATSQLGASNRVLTLAQVDAPRVLQQPEATVIQAPLQWEPASCSMGLSLFGLYHEQAQWADIIHVHYPWPFADLVHLLSRVRKPVVMTYHSDIVRQSLLERLYAPLRACFFKHVSAVVATSPNYLESSKFLRRYRCKVKVIPLGLSEDVQSCPPAQVRSDVAERFGSGYFLFVGVLRYYKGLDILLDAAKQTGFPVVIAGKGPEEEQLRAKAEKLGLDNVQFAGFVSEDVKAALFERARAVVFPSCFRSEAFGVTLLEGLLHRKPLISCELGTGTSFVNSHGETGLVVAPENAHELSEAMRALVNDEARAIQMGKAGYERLQALFSGDVVGRSYYELYKDTVKCFSAANGKK